jgi:cell division inhibitor SepF
MGFSDLWSRTLVYFGIAEDEEWDDNGYVTNEQLEESYRKSDRQNVRRLPNAVEEDDWTADQQIADRFKAQVPVIINLQGAETDLSKRLIDFASGLTYALDGSMQRVADKVFLLTPRNVELSAEDRARALERSGFYNQA